MEQSQKSTVDEMEELKNQLSAVRKENEYMKHKDKLSKFIRDGLEAKVENYRKEVDRLNGVVAAGENKFSNFVDGLHSLIDQSFGNDPSFVHGSRKRSIVDLTDDSIAPELSQSNPMVEEMKRKYADLQRDFAKIQEEKDSIAAELAKIKEINQKSVHENSNLDQQQVNLGLSSQNSASFNAKPKRSPKTSATKSSKKSEILKRLVKKNDNGATKKPMNSYMLWCQDNRKRIKAENPGRDSGTHNRKRIKAENPGRDSGTHNRRRIKAENPGRDSGTHNRLLGAEWSSLSEEEQQPWKDRYAANLARWKDEMKSLGPSTSKPHK